MQRVSTSSPLIKSNFTHAAFNNGAPSIRYNWRHAHCDRYSATRAQTVTVSAVLEACLVAPGTCCLALPLHSNRAPLPESAPRGVLQYPSRRSYLVITLRDRCPVPGPPAPLSCDLAPTSSTRQLVPCRRYLVSSTPRSVLCGRYPAVGTR